MDLNQLKSFVAVAHQGNLTQAAEALHLSQPAVSAQIKAIEKNLDIVLFERNAQGMALTRSGAALLPQAEALLQHMHQLNQFAASLAENYTGQIDVGLIYPLPGSKVAMLTQYLRQQLPQVQLNCHYKLSGDIINAVRKKELHAGFFLGPNPYRNVHSIFLEAMDYVLIAPQAWQADIEAALPKSLNQYPWIDMSPASGSHKQLQKLWRELRINPASPILCDQPKALLDMVALGIGMALVPQHDAASAIARGLPISIIQQHAQQIELSFVYAIEFEQDPMVLALKNGVHAIWLPESMAA